MTLGEGIYRSVNAAIEAGIFVLFCAWMVGVFDRD